MAQAKKKSLLRAIWELVEALAVIVALGFMIADTSWFADDSQHQDQQQSERRLPKPVVPKPQPVPQPKPFVFKPKIFRPKPVPVLVEGGEPRQGDVLLVGSKARKPSAYFQEQIAVMGGSSKFDYPMFWWTGAEKKVFALTAMGRDNRHHVASAFLLGFQPFETDKLWVPMQTIATRLKYRYDEKQFRGMRDLWQTSKQAYYWLRGDCEDHALLLADWLIEMGYDARVVAGKHGKEGHAWVVVLDQGKTYLLEATSKRKRRVMPLAVNLPEYKPEYMFNRVSFWVNSGSFLTSNYTDSRWQKRSLFYSAI